MGEDLPTAAVGEEVEEELTGKVWYAYSMTPGSAFSTETMTSMTGISILLNKVYSSFDLEKLVFVTLKGPCHEILFDLFYCFIQLQYIWSLVNKHKMFQFFAEFCESKEYAESGGGVLLNYRATEF